MTRVREAARGGPVVLLAFAALMAVQCGVSFAFPSADAITHLLLGGVAVASALTGLAVLGWRLGYRDKAPQRVWVPDLSMPTALLALGVAAMVVGVEAGPWLILIGAGLTALALAGLVREWRTQR